MEETVRDAAVAGAQQSREPGLFVPCPQLARAAAAAGLCQHDRIAQSLNPRP